MADNVPTNTNLGIKGPIMLTRPLNYDNIVPDGSYFMKMMTNRPLMLENNAHIVTNILCQQEYSP